MTNDDRTFTYLPIIRFDGMPVIIGAPDCPEGFARVLMNGEWKDVALSPEEAEKDDLNRQSLQLAGCSSPVWVVMNPPRHLVTPVPTIDAAVEGK